MSENLETRINFLIEQLSDKKEKFPEGSYQRELFTQTCQSWENGKSNSGDMMHIWLVLSALNESQGNILDKDKGKTVNQNPSKEDMLNMMNEIEKTESVKSFDVFQSLLFSETRNRVVKEKRIHLPKEWLILAALKENLENNK